MLNLFDYVVVLIVAVCQGVVVSLTELDGDLVSLSGLAQQVILEGGQQDVTVLQTNIQHLQLHRDQLNTVGKHLRKNIFTV